MNFFQKFSPYVDGHLIGWNNFHMLNYEQKFLFFDKSNKLIEEYLETFSGDKKLDEIPEEVFTVLPELMGMFSGFFVDEGETQQYASTITAAQEYYKNITLLSGLT